MITYLQAIILGLIQGVTELFPVSSLGHAVLVANVFGWQFGGQDLAESVAFMNLLVMMNFAIALALALFYRTEWARILKGLKRSLDAKDFAVDNDAKLAWILIAATVPAALLSVLLQHKLRVAFGMAFFAMVFMAINGILLIKGDKVLDTTELQRPRDRQRNAAATNKSPVSHTARVVSDHLTFQRAGMIGLAQLSGLIPGFSRTGITMLAGLRSGLTHGDAARFAFLLSTPVLLLAGLYRLPSLLSNEHASFGPVIVGALFAGVAAYFSVRYLDKYFRNKSLRPFGFYCVGLAVLMLIISVVHGTPQ